MDIKPFELERYFARYEFSVRYLLSSSDCDGLPMSEVLRQADPEAKELWENLQLGYTESQGLPLLRQEIAQLYQGIEADQILEVAPEEGVFLAMHAILRPGDQIICTFPAYQSLYQLAESLGCTVVKWLPDEASGWRFDPAFLSTVLTPVTRLLVVNFPHNPTGCLPSRKDFQEMVSFARQNGLYLFSDEMYRLLEHDPADRLPAAAEEYERAVSLFGLSKSFGLAGLRTGWVATRDAELYERMARLKDYTTICPPAPSEILALIALRAKERIVGDNLDKIRRNLTVLDGFLEQYADFFSWNRPRAGSIGFARLREGLDALQFCQQLVEETGVMLLPSTVYGFGNQHVRLGFGRENMPVALGVLSDWLKKNYFA